MLPPIQNPANEVRCLLSILPICPSSARRTQVSRNETQGYFPSPTTEPDLVNQVSNFLQLYPFCPRARNNPRCMTQARIPNPLPWCPPTLDKSAYPGRESGWWWAKRFVESFILCTYAEFYDKTQQVRITRNTETYTSGNVVTHCPLH